MFLVLHKNGKQYKVVEVDMRLNQFLAATETGEFITLQIPDCTFVKKI